jgi:hypothetical protein
MDFSDYELNEMLEEAVESGAIVPGTAAHGVALLCLDRGYAHLSAAQKSVYDIHVAPHLRKPAGAHEVEDRIRRMPD